MYYYIKIIVIDIFKYANSHVKICKSVRIWIKSQKNQILFCINEVSIKVKNKTLDRNLIYIICMRA